MAAFDKLSARDINVLGKIKDPESNPSGAVRLDFSLPKDPHITDAEEYARISQREKELILAMQGAEMQLVGVQSKTLATPLEIYRQAVHDLGDLIIEHPDYASARNNRAQALRRLYGDDMLLQRASNAVFASSAAPLLEEASEDERAEAAARTLSDLDRSITLLLPMSPLAAMSPTTAKTLSLAFTQRAAVYYTTAKRVGPAQQPLAQLGSGSDSDSATQRPEARWSQLDFEEAASHDFEMGGRFGNEIARGLAVGTNPTAKLCGQMVQQMMKMEYGPET